MTKGEQRRTNGAHSVEQRRAEAYALELRPWLTPALLVSGLRARLIRDEARSGVLLLDVLEDTLSSPTCNFSKQNVCSRRIC